MSSYKLIEINKKTSGQEVQSIYDHTDFTTLIATMNNDFGVQVKNDEVVSVYCLAIDNETGAKIDCCYYEAPVNVVPAEEGEEPVVIETTIRSRVYTHNDYASDNIAAYDTERLALGNYHTKLASAMNKAECHKAITILIDSKGNFVEFSNWTRPEEE